MEKFKVVWLCHLTNEELNVYFKKEMNMCAYWMSQFIEIVKHEYVDLHIVSPNYYTNKDVEFTIDGVTYHLYKYYSGLGGTKAAYVELALTKQYKVVKAVTNIVNRIYPDVLHLFGAENITYSKGILPFIGGIPTITSFQGYIQLAEDKGNPIRRYVVKERVKVEDTILKRCPYITFGEFEGQSKAYYMEKYGCGELLNINFPFKIPLVDATLAAKEFDIVFWGRVTVDKGVEDLINAVAILKKKKHAIKCLILGGGSDEYLSKLKSLVEEKKLDSNVIFGGFQKTNEELFYNASKAVVYVLPTHYDALPGSIRESMYMKLPVVSYPVGDIPQLNKNKECVMLANYLDIEDLASKIELLLDDSDLRNKLIYNSFVEVATACDSSYIAKQFMKSYKHVIKPNYETNKDS